MQPAGGVDRRGSNPTIAKEITPGFGYQSGSCRWNTRWNSRFLRKGGREEWETSGNSRITSSVWEKVGRVRSARSRNVVGADAEHATADAPDAFTSSPIRSTAEPRWPYCILSICGRPKPAKLNSHPHLQMHEAAYECP